MYYPDICDRMNSNVLSRTGSTSVGRPFWVDVLFQDVRENRQKGYVTKSPDLNEKQPCQTEPIVEIS